MYTKDPAPIFSKNFKLMTVNLGISRFGVSSFNLMIIWVLLYETHSPFLSGLGDGILSLPLFFSFIVGALIDKSGRKKDIAIWGGVARAVSLSTIFFGFYVNNVMLIVISIYATGFLIGFTSDILNSVRASWTKRFLSEEQYKSGSSILQTVYSMAEGAGYIASGLLLAFGFLESFISIFVVFIISLAPLLFMRVEESTEVKSARESIIEGLKFIRRSKAIMQVMIIALLGNMIFGMAGILFTTLVQIHFKIPPIYVSIIFFIFIVGMIIGSMLSRNVKGKVGNIAVVSYAIMGISLVSISILNNIFLIIVPAMVIGFVIGIINVVLNTAILKLLPELLMARIQGAFNTFSLAATFVSGMLGGILIQLTSSTESFLVIGILIIAITPLWFLFRELASIKI
ncbi:MAG: MFS transporter [Thermoplasmata archaeon]